ncbi:MAG TPA: hypothetical protein VL356_08210 [Acidocella sp.]|jgi:hypothetical protein|nr:hypothetical protein [Acidocella sp.]
MKRWSLEELTEIDHALEAERKATFCEQKVAKKLCYFGPVALKPHGPKVTQVFAPLFSKSGRLP